MWCIRLCLERRVLCSGAVLGEDKGLASGDLWARAGGGGPVLKAMDATKDQKKAQAMVKCSR